jgi:CRP-like cAMP-binding protein
MKNSTRFPQMLKAPLFLDLPEDFKVQFLNDCSVLVCEEATHLLVQGGAVQGMYLIAHGSVEITCVNACGQSVMIHLARPGEVFGDVEALSDNPCAASCTTAIGTTVLFCAKPLLYESLRAPTFVRNLMQVSYDRLVRDNRTKFIDQFYPVEQRLGAYLHLLSVDDLLISKTQGDLAGLLGCARQTLNRELGRLRERRVIELEKGRIRILDRAALIRDPAANLNA